MHVRRRKLALFVFLFCITAISVIVFQNCESSLKVVDTTPATASTPDSTTPSSINVNFTNPEVVVIQGYNGPQQDPVISADGQYLFFDTHNDSNLPTHLHFARYIDYRTFQYVGPLASAGSFGNIQIEGVSDLENYFYFIGADNSGTTFLKGQFNGTSVSNIAPLQGLSPLSAPSGMLAVFMDFYITADGNTLFFTDAVINPNTGRPQSAKCSMAKKNADGSFTRESNSDNILKNVNALGSIVYNAASSDGLVLTFNVADTGTIYTTSRSSKSLPFDQPKVLGAAQNITQGSLSEPGSISYNGKYLYFHRVLSPTTSQIYVLTRP